MFSWVASCAAMLAMGAGFSPDSPAKEPPALVAFDHAWKQLTAYNTTIKIFERQGPQTQTMVFDYSFSKPSNIAVHVLEGQNKGARLVWTGGDTVLVKRGSGLLSLLKKTVSLRDPLVTTIRGSSVSQLSFGAILAHSHQPGVLTISRGDVIDGVTTDKVTLVPSHPLADGNLTREVIEISTATHFPSRIYGYEGRTLVRTIEFSNIRLVR